MAEFTEVKLRKKADLKELRFQIQAATILDMTDLVWFHPSNEGKRTGWGQKNLTPTGVKKGVHDILIFNSSHITGESYKGLSIELKIIGNKLRDSQKIWKKKFESVGWKFSICYTIDELIYVLKKYYPDYVSHIKL